MPIIAAPASSRLKLVRAREATRLRSIHTQVTSWLARTATLAHPHSSSQSFHWSERRTTMFQLLIWTSICWISRWVQRTPSRRSTRKPRHLTWSRTSRSSLWMSVTILARGRIKKKLKINLLARLPDWSRPKSKILNQISKARHSTLWSYPKTSPPSNQRKPTLPKRNSRSYPRSFKRKPDSSRTSWTRRLRTRSSTWTSWSSARLRRDLLWRHPCANL